MITGSELTTSRYRSYHKRTEAIVESARQFTWLDHLFAIRSYTDIA